MLSGSFLILATFAIFMPVSLMSQTHSWLGLGEMPESAITLYLARSTSIMYAVHGFVMFYTGLKIESLWPMVWLIGVIHVAIGSVLIWVDISSAMPTYWTVMEGGPIAGLGVLILFLDRKSRRLDARHQQ